MESSEFDVRPDAIVETSADTDPDSGFLQLDSGHISAERIARLIFFAIVLVGAFVGLGIKLLFGGFDTILISLAIALVFVLTFLFWSAVFWPKISHRHIHWKLDETGLEIHRGVWWKHRIAVPLARVQHADVSQGPLQRHYGIGTLTIHTAGTTNASVELAGLNHLIALDLRDRLVRQGKAGANATC